MTTLPLTYEYFLDAKHEWRFRVRGGNHEIMLQSEGYVDRQSAVHALDVLKAGMATAQLRPAVQPGTNAFAAFGRAYQPSTLLAAAMASASPRNLLSR